MTDSILLPQIAQLIQSAPALSARFVLNDALSKSDQLKLASAIAYFGEGQQGPVIGFAQAAQAYFQVEFSALTEPQYVQLIAMLIAPNQLHPQRAPQALALRVRRIQAMLDGAYVPKGLRDVYYDQG